MRRRSGEGAGKSSEACAPDTIGIADFSRGQFSKIEFKRLHTHGQRCLPGLGDPPARVRVNFVDVKK